MYFAIFSLLLDSSEAMGDLKMPSFFRLFGSFIALIAVMWLLILFLRKMSSTKTGFFKNDSNIKVLEKRSLSPKTSVYVIEYQGKKTLIAESSLHLKMNDIEEL